MVLFKKIIRFSLVGLFFITPFLFTSFNSELFEIPKMFFVYALTIVIVISHLINWSQGNVPLHKKSFLDISLMLFLVSQIISTLFSVDPHTSIFGYYSRLNGGLLSSLTYGVLYWIALVYWDDEFKDWLIKTSLLSGFFVAVYGIAEHFGIDKNLWVQDVQSRVFSTLGQPNWLAAYLCILIPLALENFISLFKSKKYLLSQIFLAAGVVFYLCLLYTKSKSGIIAALISLSIYFSLQLATDLKQKLNFKPIFIFMFFLVGTSLLIDNPIKDKLFPESTETLPIAATTDSTPLNITPSEEIRKIVWKGTIDLWKQFPFFGTGPETFAYSYYWTRPAEHNLTSEWDFLYNKAHNEYLNFLATTGTFGFSAYILLIAASLFVIIKNKNWSVLAAEISLLITNFAGFSVVITSLYFIFFPLLAISSTKSKENKQSLNWFKKNIIPLIAIFFFIFLMQKLVFYYLADIYYSRSQTLDSKQQYKAAFNDIEFSVNARPDEPQFLIQYSSLAAKMVLISAANKDQVSVQNYIQKTISYSNKAVSISPANTNLWKERAQSYYYLATVDPQYFTECIASLNKAKLLAPTDAKIYYLLGKFLELGSNKTEAAKYYQEAVRLKPNYDYAFFALGLIEYENKNYPEAKNNFQSAININPANKEALQYINNINNINSKKY